MSILTGNTGSGFIYFGDAEDNDIGRIEYTNNANTFKFYTNNTQAFSINSSQNSTFVGDLRVDGGDIGITSDTDLLSLAINQLTVRGEIDATGGTHIFGVADTTGAVIKIRGNATGSNEGGQINLELAADHDGTFNQWIIDILADDMRIFGPSGIIHKFKAEGEFELDGNLELVNEGG